MVIGLGVMTNKDKLVKWDHAARERFTYVTDDVQFGVTDDWRSHADDVLAGKHWKDDCDGLASTVLDLLARDGYDPSLMYRAVVDSTGKGDKIDHFVGIVSDGSELFVVGDTFGPVYPIKEMRHKLVAVSRVSEGIHWQRVKDFPQA